MGNSSRFVPGQQFFQFEHLVILLKIFHLSYFATIDVIDQAAAVKNNFRL